MSIQSRKRKVLRGMSVAAVVALVCSCSTSTPVQRSDRNAMVTPFPNEIRLRIVNCRVQARNETDYEQKMANQRCTSLIKIMLAPELLMMNLSKESPGLFSSSEDAMPVDVDVICSQKEDTRGAAMRGFLMMFGVPVCLKTTYLIDVNLEEKLTGKTIRKSVIIDFVCRASAWHRWPPQEPLDFQGEVCKAIAEAASTLSEEELLRMQLLHQNQQLIVE